MDSRELIYEAFLAGFAQEGRRSIGVELEFPLLNLAKAPVTEELAHGLMAYLLMHGFRADEYDTEGRPVFLINADGDELSFDNSYNNFEFAMAKTEDLTAVSERFYRLFDLVQDYLLPRGHTLCGMGSNLYHPYIQPSPVKYPVYEAIGRFLRGFRGGAYHNYPDFPAYLSSVQTHLDVPLTQLPRAFTLFAALDFVRALLFSNSPAFPDAAGYERTVCYRDTLWERSGFGSLADNVGKVEGVFRTPEDIVNKLLGKSMFNRVRNGQYELFEPVSVGRYFQSGAPASDVEYYLSFQNVEVTRRGTLEIRSDCTQPLHSAFAPPAFHLGLLTGLTEAEAMLYGFFEREVSEQVRCSPHRNALLRDAVILRGELPASEQAVRRLLMGLVELAEEKLRARGLGEERLLRPLHRRAEELSCPARETMRQMAAGVPLEELIRQSVRRENK